jgi:hypothetical protein
LIEQIIKMKMNNRFQISYYPSYKDWANQLWLQGWPGYLCLIISALIGILAEKPDFAIYTAFLSFFILLFCVFGTVFYANSVLEITENGLIVTKNKTVTYFNWINVSNIVFVTPSGRASYRETVMVIYHQINKEEKIDYIFIESLYFKWANIRAAEIGYIIEKYRNDYTFKIYKSNFFTRVFLKRRNLIPTIYN